MGAGVAEAFADDVAGVAIEDVAEKSVKTDGWTLLWWRHDLEVLGPLSTTDT